MHQLLKYVCIFYEKKNVSNLKRLIVCCNIYTHFFHFARQIQLKKSVSSYLILVHIRGSLNRTKSKMEIRWYLLAVIAMQFIVLLFGLLGHGNEIKKSGNTHAGLWKVCVGDSCSEVKKSSFPDSSE